jgi:hypothetical protein
MTDIRETFTEAMTQFFASIPNGVRKSTEDYLSSFPAPTDDSDHALVLMPDGGMMAAISMTPPNGKLAVYFGSAPDGTVALRIDLKAADMKTLAALVDTAAAGLCGLDGVSLVEEWARQ